MSITVTVSNKLLPRRRLTVEKRCAINAMLCSLLLDWSDNGSISAEVVRDGVMATICHMTGWSLAHLQVVLEKIQDNIEQGNPSFEWACKADRKKGN